MVSIGLLIVYWRFDMKTFLTVWIACVVIGFFALMFLGPVIFYNFLMFWLIMCFVIAIPITWILGNSESIEDLNKKLQKLSKRRKLSKRDRLIKNATKNKALIKQTVNSRKVRRRR